MRKLFFVVFLFAAITCIAQTKTRNLVIVTLDGMRWQEIFGGIDDQLLSDKKFTMELSI